MISSIDVNDWLRAHTALSNDPPGLRWPSGVVHTWEESRMLVRAYMELGLEPTDLATSQMIGTLVGRLVALEQEVQRLKETKE